MDCGNRAVGDLLGTVPSLRRASSTWRAPSASCTARSRICCCSSWTFAVRSGVRASKAPASSSSAGRHWPLGASTFSLIPGGAHSAPVAAEHAPRISARLVSTSTS